MVNYTLDQDGDVEMKTAQPMYEFIAAPRVTSWSQSSLIKWVRERKQTTGEDYKSVVASVKGSVEAKLLENLCHYILKSTVEKVTDTNILDEANKRCGTPMNEHLPDVRELVKSKLKVDMKEDDVQARILKYFSDFNAIVDDNGPQIVIGRDLPFHFPALPVSMNRRRYAEAVQSGSRRANQEAASDDFPDFPDESPNDILGIQDCSSVVEGAGI
ncbi:hypothetical protein PsorP6_011343 [Peronosclerospora sorghi]|uniref:Uncharacterized protein n=1 Tax=Peronosclerospora sorghi TaxID=230839 RepID=A0ACC0WI48_9STRA|nr:hypothetical protein PsorP6_011343 [Peronosclerospora sorghi]